MLPFAVECEAKGDCTHRFLTSATGCNAVLKKCDESGCFPYVNLNMSLGDPNNHLVSS